MGVTITHKIALQIKYAKSTIDEIERVAKAIKENQADKLNIMFEVNRLSTYKLFIDIDDCETLAFDFKPMSEHLEGYKNYNWNPFDDVITFEESHTGQHYETWPDQKLLWSSGFCKTQYASTPIAHKWVADITKVAASRASLAIVRDEGDYYHSGKIDDAIEAIDENGQLIKSIGNTLNGLGYDVIKGGETTIKPINHKK